MRKHSLKVFSADVYPFWACDKHRNISEQE